MPATAWNHLVVALKPGADEFGCELRDRRVLSLPLEWKNQISVTDHLHVSEEVTAVDRTTALHLERNGRPDLAQIPVLAASPPKRSRFGRSFVMLDTEGAQHGIERVLVTSEQIRDYFFAPNRGASWEEQPTWFDVLGVRPSSTPAEIRLAYRVRDLELKTVANNSSQVTQTQLARGLQILMDPGLRREYMALLENPPYDVSFPPWTIGCLLATGKRKDKLFVVKDLLRFVPHTEECNIRIALRWFRFEGPLAVYRDARKRLLIRFDTAVLPMQWTEEWNTWAHLALGTAVITATFWQQTRFRRVGTGFQAKIWSQPLASTLTIQNPSSLATKFEAARAFWKHFHPHAEIVALLRARIEEEPIEAQQAADWCVQRGVRAPVDARRINWEPDYDESYYRELAGRAKAVYLFRNEYLFLFESTIISEIPKPGHASYVFHQPSSLDSFLRNYARTTRHGIRSEPTIAGKTLGYCGRIAHLKDIALWLSKIERAVAGPAANRSIA